MPSWLVGSTLWDGKWWLRTLSVPGKIQMYPLWYHVVGTWDWLEPKYLLLFVEERLRLGLHRSCRFYNGFVLQNEGTCVNLIDDYFCVCPFGVHGKNCEVAPNRCIGEPCHNGGVCGDFGSRLECTCPKGKLWPIFSSVPWAQNMHSFLTCWPTEQTNWQNSMKKIWPEVVILPETNCFCICWRFLNRFIKNYKLCSCEFFEQFTDYVGVGCQYELDACTAEVCQNGATCTDFENGYKCECPAGQLKRF